ncbi:MAG: DNA mismatch repair endonuclease MutL [Chloroflexota bacterium]|nr:DNA mismatch repair endonuclease MutL [Chloroflexota bacterium]
MSIRVLPPNVAAKIAAGEVVERPASVAKELVENAIDAGADDIRIRVVDGGRRLVQVSDNGEGIPADEVELAFARHATSKIRSADDLYRIRTLGFRGEALASIAAVSQLTLSTRTRQQNVGTSVRLEGGTLVRREPVARPPGTLVKVENLFYNTPARLKFLRTEATEAGHVSRLVSSYALAYPEKHFTLQNNERMSLRTTGTGDQLDVLVTLYGLDVAEQMLQVERLQDEESPIQVWGYVGAPALNRSNGQDVMFFVNRRWIQDRSLSYAVNQAYRTLIPERRYPIVLLNIQVPPQQVDVNIHPTKREVRFRNPGAVFRAVQRAVRSKLMSQHPVPRVHTPADRSAQRPSGRDPLTPAQVRLALDVHRTADIDRERASSFSRLPPEERLPMLRVVGQIAQTYIIAEGPGGMYLIDQHAAHERIRYETLKAQQRASEVVSQELLEPQSITASPQQARLLEEHLDTLETYGFKIRPVEGTTFSIERVPANLHGECVSAAVWEMLDAAMEGSEGFSWEDQALITLSCHTAIRAGQTLSLQEMRDLVRQLEQSDLPHSCPHGRPTMVHLSEAQLEREFGRR